MSILFQDLRFGLRSLLRQPLFTCAAVLVLALGIGANIAVFSVINAVLLRPLPYPQPNRLLLVRENARLAQRISVSYPDYLDWLAGQRSFTDLALMRGDSFDVSFQAGRGLAPERVEAAIVTANFLSVLGVRPEVGRDFQASDDVPGASPVTWISDAFWRRRYAADPKVIGRNLKVEGIDRAIVGVLPPQVEVPRECDVYIPLTEMRKEPGILNRGNHPGFSALGRLKAGVSLEQAKADLNNIALELARRYPDTNTGNSVDVRTLLESKVGAHRDNLYLLLGAVACVLLIASANVANLQLARATGRRKELAVRAALGASRWRLVRQMLTEGVLLSLLGGGLAILLALWTIDAIIGLTPASMTRFHDVRVDLPVLGYTALLALGTGLLVGIWPAWRMSTTAAMSRSLQEGNSRGSTGGAGQQQMRSLLVIAQMALAVVLLAGAGLTLKSFYRVETEALGFKSEGLLVLSISLPETRYNKAQRDVFTGRLLDKVRALPGVTAAGMGLNVPYDEMGWSQSFHVTGTPPDKPGNEPETEVSYITPGYFGALGNPIRHGRDFGTQDGLGQTEAVIIDEAFARAYFPGRDPIGEHIDDENVGPGETKPPFTIVGVVAHTRNDPPSADAAYLPPAYQMYLCAGQWDPFATTLLVRVPSGDPLRLAESVRKVVGSLDPEVPVAKVSTMERNIAKELAPRRLTMVLLAAFAAVALVLASIGLYGVMALGVTQRTRELGIRLALGAQRGAVLALVMRQGVFLVGIGLFVGLAVALGSGRWLASVLYGVNGSDPAMLATVSLVLGAAALLACLLPAQRATRVDPMEALRNE